MCIYNTTSENKTISLTNYLERTQPFSGGLDVLTGKQMGKSFTIHANESLILALTK
jgi:hypothetical protein